VSLSEDKYIRPISLITQFILDLDESMGLKYRKASKKLFVNGQELSDRDYVSDYPKDTEFTLEITEGDPQMEENMELTISLNRNYTIFAKPYETIQELKAKIEEETKNPPSEQRVIFKGQQLLDERTLADYGIHDKSSVFVALWNS
jgi:hypothetical protein